MRLYTVYFLCKNNVEFLQKIEGIQSSQNREEYRINEWEDIKKTIDNIYSIKSLQDDIKQIYSLVPIYYFYHQFILFNKATYDKFQSRINILVNSMLTIIDLYESFDYEQTENNLEIKVPDGLSLEEISELTNDLNIIIQQNPFIERESDIGKVLKTDVGSIWLILLGSAAFLISVGYLVNVTTKAKGDLITIRQSRALFAEMNLKSDILSEVKKGLDEQKNIIMEKYIGELTEKTGRKLNDNEERAKAEMCIEKLDKWMDKGMQIYAAIDTPREIQVLFPEQPELKNLTGDTVKLIEALAKESQ